LRPAGVVGVDRLIDCKPKSLCFLFGRVVQVVQDLLIGGKASPRVCPNSSQRIEVATPSIEATYMRACGWVKDLDGFGTRL